MTFSLELFIHSLVFLHIRGLDNYFYKINVMKHVLLMLFVTTSCTLQAQIEKGNFLAGGTLSFRSTNYSNGNSKTSAWNFTPGGGYFTVNK